MELFLQQAADYIYVRGLRGGILFYDPVNGQLYRRTGAVGADNFAEFVRVVRCVTVPTLRSLGHNLAGYPAPGQHEDGNCGGHPAIEVHHVHPLFEERDLRMLYLRHSLRLRITLHRSKKPALAFFRELWARYFPGQPCNDHHGRMLIRSMGHALKSAADDGVLFSVGSDEDGGGPVTRETRPELARNFPTADRLMEVYAKCYEWVHWEVIMLRFSKYFIWFFIHIYIPLNFYFKFIYFLHNLIIFLNNFLYINFIERFLLNKIYYVDSKVQFPHYLILQFFCLLLQIFGLQPLFNWLTIVRLISWPRPLLFLLSFLARRLPRFSCSSFMSCDLFFYFDN